jgi:hypothetical protein
VLRLESGPATLIPPFYIDKIKDAPTSLDGLMVCHDGDDHRIFFEGDFSGFHLYLIVTHPRLEIVPGTVKLIERNLIEATIAYNDSSSVVNQTIRFESPLIPILDVKECRYGRNWEAFELCGPSGHQEKLVLDLSFYSFYSLNGKNLPLQIEYIGIAAKNGRQAHDRLGEGHQKLDKVLADLVRRDVSRAAALVLYKTGDLRHPEISFPEIVETLEASLIQHFKPPMNTEHIDFPHKKTILTSKLKYFKMDKISAQIQSPKSTVLDSKYLACPRMCHNIYLDIP